MMAKKDKMARGHGCPKEAFPAIERLRKMAAEPLISNDGPPSPDAELLDVCAEALHFLTMATRAIDDRFAGRRAYEETKEAYEEGVRRAKAVLPRVRKLRAVTAAGIYAKALVVRCSRIGAPTIAVSLAEDLIACPGLRASLWPAEVEPGD